MVHYINLQKIYIHQKLKEINLTKASEAPKVPNIPKASTP